MRNQVRKYVLARKSGEQNSQVEGKADILTLLFKFPDVFDDEDIVDVVLDFFFAGTMT